MSLRQSPITISCASASRPEPMNVWQSRLRAAAHMRRVTHFRQMTSSVMTTIGQTSEARFTKRFEESPPRSALEVPVAAKVGSGLWQMHLPLGKRTHVPKASKPQNVFNSISKLRSYRPHHDKWIPHGSDGGVAVSVILNEIWAVAGGDPRRPHLHTANKLIDMLRKGSNTL